jgi:hypothetical protein
MEIACFLRELLDIYTHFRRDRLCDPLVRQRRIESRNKEPRISTKNRNHPQWAENDSLVGSLFRVLLFSFDKRLSFVALCVRYFSFSQ